jgi:hypothetical protein
MIDEDRSPQRNDGQPIGTAIRPTYTSTEQQEAVARVTRRGLRDLGWGLAYYDQRLLAGGAP